MTDFLKTRSLTTAIFPAVLQPSEFPVMRRLLLSATLMFAPLILVVDSGGKSLHGWFRVDHLGLRDQARLFAVGCLLGCDPTRWDLCGWLRMPGGLRQVQGVRSARQRLLHPAP